MSNVVNKMQLDQLCNSTYIYAVIVVAIAIALAIFITSIINWQGGKDRSYITRRVWFAIIGIVSVLGFWLYNDMVVIESVKGAGFQNMFRACNLRCIGITSLGYLVVSAIIMLCFRHSKFGSILPNKLKK